MKDLTPLSLNFKLANGYCLLKGRKIKASESHSSALVDKDGEIILSSETYDLFDGFEVLGAPEHSEIINIKEGQKVLLNPDLAMILKRTEGLSGQFFTIPLKYVLGEDGEMYEPVMCRMVNVVAVL